MICDEIRVPFWCLIGPPWLDLAPTPALMPALNARPSCHLSCLTCTSSGRLDACLVDFAEPQESSGLEEVHWFV
jgi:hypothetical protein